MFLWNVQLVILIHLPELPLNVKAAIRQNILPLKRRITPLPEFRWNVKPVIPPQHGNLRCLTTVPLFSHCQELMQLLYSVQVAIWVTPLRQNPIVSHAIKRNIMVRQGMWLIISRLTAKYVTIWLTGRMQNLTIR